MQRQLVWPGNDGVPRVWSVEIPAEISRSSEADIWSYVQRFIVSGESEAMKGFFRTHYPGISWDTNGTHAAVSVVSVTSCGGQHGMSYSDDSYSSRNYSQKPRAPHASRGAKNAESGTSDSHKRSPRVSTSNASRPHARGSAGDNRTPSGHSTRPFSTPRTAGWMGSTSTKPTASPIALRA